MKNRKELILPAIVVVLLAGVAGWILVSYGGKFALYNDLYNNGVRTRAVLIQKGVFKDGRLLQSKITDQSDDHRFLVGFRTKEGDEAICRLSVSKRTYDVIGKRDQLGIAYLPSDPSKCTLPHSLGYTRILVMSMTGVGVFLLLIAAGFCFYIYSSFRKPGQGNPVTLTTNLGIDDGAVLCPRCREEMTEGYIPTAGGITWRNRDDPVGIPTILTGLPGTKFFLKRPRLHAYRCESCRIVTFKYGK